MPCVALAPLKRLPPPPVCHLQGHYCHLGRGARRRRRLSRSEQPPPAGAAAAAGGAPARRRQRARRHHWRPIWRAARRAGAARRPRGAAAGRGGGRRGDERQRRRVCAGQRAHNRDRLKPIPDQTAQVGTLRWAAAAEPCPWFALQGRVWGTLRIRLESSASDLQLYLRKPACDLSPGASERNRTLLPPCCSPCIPPASHPPLPLPPRPLPPPHPPVQLPPAADTWTPTRRCARRRWRRARRRPGRPGWCIARRR